MCAAVQWSTFAAAVNSRRYVIFTSRCFYFALVHSCYCCLILEIGPHTHQQTRECTDRTRAHLPHGQQRPIGAVGGGWKMSRKEESESREHGTQTYEWREREKKKQHTHGSNHPINSFVPLSLYSSVLFTHSQSLTVTCCWPQQSLALSWSSARRIYIW